MTDKPNNISAQHPASLLPAFRRSLNAFVNSDEYRGLLIEATRCAVEGLPRVCVELKADGSWTLNVADVDGGAA